MYDGRWELDLRSGAGKMTYSNGDVFDGIWHRDMVSELSNKAYRRYVVEDSDR